MTAKKTLMLISLALATAAPLSGCARVLSRLPPTERAGVVIAGASAPLANCPTNPREIAAVKNARLALDLVYEILLTQRELEALAQARGNTDEACDIPSGGVSEAMPAPEAAPAPAPLS